MSIKDYAPRYDPLRTRCACCGYRPAAFTVSFKPSERIYQVALCARCFDENKINESFLSGCMLNQQHQAEARRGKKRINA